MKKISLVILCCAALCVGSASAMEDLYVTYNYAIAGDGTLTTPNNWAIVETFNNNPTLDQSAWTYAGNGAIVIGSGQVYAAPYNSSLMSEPDATYYFSTPQNNELLGFGVNWATINFEQGDEEVAYDYLGIFWGSVDTYNTFEFMNDGLVVETFTGTQIIYPDPANGNQSAPYSNQYVNFYNVQAFDAVRFISTDFSLEFDNLAVGVTPVPVPGALLLGMLGLSIVGVKLRRFA